MAQVDFHFNAPDKWAYVCRLLRKGSVQGKRMGVCAAAETVHFLNQSLWNLNASDFVSHCLSTDSAVLLAQSSVVLAEDWSSLQALSGLDVWVNLKEAPPPDMALVARLIEVVGPDDEDKLNARLRWKHYTQRGFAINRFDLAAQTA